MLLGLVFCSSLLPQTVIREYHPLSHTFKPALQTEVSGILIEGNEQFESSGYPGTGTSDDPYLIDFLNIVGTTEGIVIENTDAYFVIRDCLIGGFIGIRFTNVMHGAIENTTITAADRGILLQNSTSISIVDSDIREAVTGIYGIQLDDSLIDSCKVHHNQNGIFIDNGTFNDVSNSDVYANANVGIYLGNQTRNITIFSNNIGWNGEINDFNIYDVTNADDSGSNSWTSNRWSDYANTGAPYTIQDGTSNARDLFPSLLTDIVVPSVQGSDDIRYDEGESGHRINWNSTDEFMLLYQIYLDGALVENGDWYGGRLIYNADGLELGSHNITAVFRDASGNRARDEVWVAVLISIFGGEGTIYVFYGSMLSVLFVLTVLGILKRMR